MHTATTLHWSQAHVTVGLLFAAYRGSEVADALNSLFTNYL